MKFMNTELHLAVNIARPAFFLRQKSSNWVIFIQLKEHFTKLSALIKLSRTSHDLDQFTSA